MNAIVNLLQLFGCGFKDDPVRYTIIMFCLFLGTVFILEPIGKMVSLWQEKAKSPSLSTRSSNQGVEEIIFALKDVYEKRIKEIQDNHRSEIQAMENERSCLKATLKEKDEFVQKVTENVARLMTRTTTNEEESVSSRKCQESNKEEEVEKERKELADALKEIAKLKEDLEELRREVRAGQKNDKDASQSRKRPRKYAEENQDPQSRFWAGFTTKMDSSGLDIYSLVKTDSTRRTRDAEVVNERETASRKGSKLRRWNGKIKRWLKPESKHDPMWDELREGLLRDWQKLSRSEVIPDSEIKDILQDMEQMFKSEIEMGKEDIEAVLKHETPETEPKEVLEDTEIFEEIREIIEEEKAERRSKRRWEKNAWKSVIREHKERKANERADKKLRKQQLLSRKREEKEKKTQRKAEKGWVSAVKRNIMEQHEERKQKRNDRLKKLRDLIEFVKQERKIMKQKKKADREWLEREAMSLALYDHQVRMEEQKRKKEARRAFKQELKERNAQLKDEKDRLKNEIRTKLEEEHKRRKAKAKLEKQKLNSASNDLKRRKKDLWRKRKPKRSKVEVELRDCVLLFIQDPTLFSFYHKKNYKYTFITQDSPLEHREKWKRARKGTHSQKKSPQEHRKWWKRARKGTHSQKKSPLEHRKWWKRARKGTHSQKKSPLENRKWWKRSRKGTHSQKEVWVWKRNSIGKYELIEKKKIDRTASNK
ncbi:trichohyalin-like [Macrobrachium nipponense]|uniref:trichohyalin-like n=1 Tax=Macrobrachium nipponense TaxID=159736 RepID=UPI0030C864F7